MASRGQIKAAGQLGCGKFSLDVLQCWTGVNFTTSSVSPHSLTGEGVKKLSEIAYAFVFQWFLFVTSTARITTSWQ